MKYIVDRIENGYAVLENIETKEMLDVLVEDLPDIKSGSVLIYNDGIYTLNNEIEKKRKNLLQEKMNRLRNE